MRRSATILIRSRRRSTSFLLGLGPLGTADVNQTLAAPGFGPAGLHPQVLGPEGQRAPLPLDAYATTWEEPLRAYNGYFRLVAFGQCRQKSTIVAVIWCSKFAHGLISCELGNHFWIDFLNLCDLQIKLSQGRVGVRFADALKPSDHKRSMNL